LAGGVGLLGGLVDDGVYFGDERGKGGGGEGILDEEVSLGAIEIELVGGEVTHE
jgi:hypothetical protein